MKKALLTQILQSCSRELRKHPQWDCFPHWTFLVKSNSIISIGVNRECEPHPSLGYHSIQKQMLRGDSFRPKWHSELDAIKRCRQAIYDCTAINVRLNKSGQIRLSMPCSACRNLLRVVNCKRCIFTHETGWGELML